MDAELRAAARDLCRFAGRFSAGDIDVQRGDLQAAIEEVERALAAPAVTETDARSALVDFVLRPGWADSRPSGPRTEKGHTLASSLRRRLPDVDIDYDEWIRDIEVDAVSAALAAPAVTETDGSTVDTARRYVVEVFGSDVLQALAAPAVTETDLRDEARAAFASDGIAAANKVWPKGVDLVAKLALAAPAVTETDHAPGCDVFRIAESWEPYGVPRHCDCGFAVRDAKRRGVYNWTPPAPAVTETDRQHVIEGLVRAYDIVKPEPGMDGPHGGHISGPSRQKAALAIDAAIEALAAPAVTETDLRAAAQALVDEWDKFHDLRRPSNLDAAEARLRATLAAPAVTEADLRARRDYILAIPAAAIDAYLASPQAAEELARAIRDTFGGTPPTCHQQATAILAALQKVRHPEEA